MKKYTVVKPNYLKCSKCGGFKYVGTQYYAMKKNWVDVTCVVCSDTKDIEVKKLNLVLKALGFKQIKERYVIPE
jgi:hypothetical protein